jgi:hypothetical protein
MGEMFFAVVFAQVNGTHEEMRSEWIVFVFDTTRWRRGGRCNGSRSGML